jgi:N-acetyl-gamma-glutamyl-phosphate reductase
MMRAAVLGASGYAGAELMRLALGHDELDVVLATGDATAGQRLGAVAPSLAAAYPDLLLGRHEDVESSDAEVVFLALPHGVSQRFVGRLRADGRIVVDLGADFRLRDAADYEQWYGHTHGEPAMLSEAVYALVERHRKELAGAGLLAIPGCYPTATALALGPFVDAGWLAPGGHVVNALSGISGAGRATSEELQFTRLAGSAEAYGLTAHRHTIEMQRELGVELLFVPHRVPVARGMLVTAYARLVAPRTSKDALELLRAAYAGERFVAVLDGAPTMKDANGSNLCLVSARVDERTGWLVAMGALDNLVKGAAGQAVQALNVAMGYDEAAGLTNAGVSP